MMITTEFNQYQRDPHGLVYKTNCKEQNLENNLDKIIQRYMDLRAHENTLKTHYFGNRFENIYPPRDLFPELEPLLETVNKLALKILKTRNKLSMSFWFNEMSSGNSTTLHTHDEDGEKLSVVIYFLVPNASGDIYFYPSNQPSFSLTPEVGDILFFSPALAHEVSCNKSQSIRLSMALNLGFRDN